MCGLWVLKRKTIENRESILQKTKSQTFGQVSNRYLHKGTPTRKKNFSQNSLWLRWTHAFGCCAHHMSHMSKNWSWATKKQNKWLPLVVVWIIDTITGDLHSPPNAFLHQRVFIRTKMFVPIKWLLKIKMLTISDNQGNTNTDQYSHILYVKNKRFIWLPSQIFIVIIQVCVSG